jgi:hypothetical protein
MLSKLAKKNMPEPSSKWLKLRLRGSSAESTLTEWAEFYLR